MFVQIIEGRVSDPQAVVAATDAWIEELSEGAPGWLGLTGGTTEDGRSILVVRFESEEAARRNSDRPEQGRWWTETGEKVYEDGATFTDSTDVTVDVAGDPNQAGFVQVMKGRTTDPERSRELMMQDSDRWAAYRPDVLGSLVVGHPDGAYTVVSYFTSEAEARAGEQKEVPPELAAQLAEMGELEVGEIQYFDLAQPIIRSPR